MGQVIAKIKRGLKKPPRYIVYRVWKETQIQFERWWGPKRVQQLTASKLLHHFGYTQLSTWWTALGNRPYPTNFNLSLERLNQVCPAEKDRIFAAADRALDNQVNLLGSGWVALGSPIDWLKDYKTGWRWPLAYMTNIDYCNPDRPSDVKFPWELSRMQWMIPLGQAYILTQDERYAQAVKNRLLEWMDANPYAGSVNWSCTMEVALRIITWTWFFHAFKSSQAWNDAEFQTRFLKTLYLHADFTARHLEKSDVNGNHYTADAAGLVFAGLFFNHASWTDLGWAILCDELPKQVFEDGVDYEASIAYHRLVQELFLFPALFRKACDLEVPSFYCTRLIAMAEFTAAYTRKDGTTPLWGDADDARTLPLGGQDLNDHRYLLGLVGIGFNQPDLLTHFSGSPSELLWIFGDGYLKNSPPHLAKRSSKAFAQGGFYILQNEKDHVFIDCGPLGLAGRGGHGHNDLLSFEAVLNGVHLITDCGSYVYTADFKERNLFRSTAYHNTPQVNGEEINRFIGPDFLWNLHNDAKHQVRELCFGEEKDNLIISHDGYARLKEGVVIVRRFELDHRSHSLQIDHDFEVQHVDTTLAITIPFHLAPGVQVQVETPHTLILQQDSVQFQMVGASEGEWCLSVEPCRVSSSYGLYVESKKIVWHNLGSVRSLKVKIIAI